MNFSETDKRQVGVAAIATLLVVQALSGMPSQAADLKPDGFKEEYAGGADVGGELLVGLAYSSEEGGFELGKVQLDVSGDETTVCIQMSTSDGRYWALNDYEKEGVDDGQLPRVNIPTKYEGHLRGYKNTDFLVLARNRKCGSSKKEELLPARVGAPLEPKFLKAFVNINRGTVKAQVERGGQAFETVTCARVPGAGFVAYSRVCSIRTEHLVAQRWHGLQLSITSLTGEVKTETFRFFVSK